MKEYMKFGFGNVSNTTAIKMALPKGDYVRGSDVSKVCRRFLQSVALLDEREFIGWQIDAGVSNSDTSMVYTNSDLKVTEEDYRWIFRECASTVAKTSNRTNDLYIGNRRVYMLLPLQEARNDFCANKKRNRDYLYDDEDFSNEYCMEMYSMLVDAGAIVNIVSGPTNDNAVVQGMVFISLPEEMTLRMQTIISLAFPQMHIEVITEEQRQGCERGLLTDDKLLESMSIFLYSFLCTIHKMKKNEQDRENSVDEDMEEDDKKDEKTIENTSDSYMPIEDLKLSVRSYNSLKRAGIHSVEQLRAMTDEELMHVRNLGRKCVAEIQQRLAENQVDSKAVPMQNISYMDMLSELIGLEGVKEQIRKIAAFAKMKQDMDKCEGGSASVVLNMEFVGNPGTAKTTVARIVAGIFHEIGILSSNKMIEVGRADLIAEYQGQTARKVQEVFRKAKGKLLFVDEAYSLLDDWKRGYGDEAISTIVQEMENNREDTIVIFAGYPDEMVEFFSRNPGLRSRVPFNIRFHDYAADEMFQIAELEAKKRGFSFAPEASEIILSLCKEAAGKAEAGNGRFCRNLIENAILEYAARVYGNETSDIAPNFVLTSDDFSEKHVQNMESSLKNVIGFKA